MGLQPLGILGLKRMISAELVVLCDRLPVYNENQIMKHRRQQRSECR